MAGVPREECRNPNAFFQITGNHVVESKSSATFQIRVMGAEPVGCSVGADVLSALEYAGVTHIPVGCRRGGCGVCRVRIINGEVVRKKMSRAKVSVADEEKNYALACCIFPRSDLTITPAPLDKNA